LLGKPVSFALNYKIMIIGGARLQAFGAAQLLSGALLGCQEALLRIANTSNIHGICF
jgi:hypothetical protein